MPGSFLICFLVTLALLATIAEFVCARIKAPKEPTSLSIVPHVGISNIDYEKQGLGSTVDSRDLSEAEFVLAYVFNTPCSPRWIKSIFSVGAVGASLVDLQSHPFLDCLPRFSKFEMWYGGKMPSGRFTPIHESDCDLRSTALEKVTFWGTSSYIPAKNYFRGSKIWGFANIEGLSSDRDAFLGNLSGPLVLLHGLLHGSELSFKQGRLFSHGRPLIKHRVCLYYGESRLVLDRRLLLAQQPQLSLHQIRLSDIDEYLNADRNKYAQAQDTSAEELQSGRGIPIEPIEPEKTDSKQKCNQKDAPQNRTKELIGLIGFYLFTGTGLICLWHLLPYPSNYRSHKNRPWSRLRRYATGSLLRVDL
jgi:hypothetical protein